MAIVMCPVDTGDSLTWDFTVKPASVGIVAAVAGVIQEEPTLDYTLQFTPDPYRIIVRQQVLASIGATDLIIMIAFSPHRCSWHV